MYPVRDSDYEVVSVSYRTMPETRRRKRARVAKSMAGRRGLRRSIPKSGTYRSQKKLVRKQFVPRAPKAFAHRQLSVRTAENWPLSAAPGAGLQQLTCTVPWDVWGTYQRGFDIAQVTSLALYSRNVTCRTVIQPPVKSGAAQAYQFRVVSGMCKRQLNQVMTSTAGSSGMADGIVLNFDPSSFQTMVFQTLEDFVGTMNGDLNGTGAFDRLTFQVISDNNYVINADTTDTAGNTYYPTKVLNFNFATKKTMRLYPYATGGAIPGSGVPDGYSPVNNPTMWVPFVALICTNFSQFTADADRPKVQNTWAHYWDQL